MAHRGGGGRVWTCVSGVLVRCRRGFRTGSHVVEIARSSFQTPNHMTQLIHRDTILILDASHWHEPQRRRLLPTPTPTLRTTTTNERGAPDTSTSRALGMFFIYSFFCSNNKYFKLLRVRTGTRRVCVSRLGFFISPHTTVPGCQ